MAVSVTERYRRIVQFQRCATITGARKVAKLLRSDGALAWSIDNVAYWEAALPGDYIDVLV